MQEMDAQKMHKNQRKPDRSEEFRVLAVLRTLGLDFSEKCDSGNR